MSSSRERGMGSCATGEIRVEEKKLEESNWAEIRRGERLTLLEVSESDHGLIRKSQIFHA